MMPVDDEAREQFVVRELLPEDVGMTGERRCAAVAEMRRQRRASVHRGVNVIRDGPRVLDVLPIHIEDVEGAVWCVDEIHRAKPIVSAGEKF